MTAKACNRKRYLQGECTHRQYYSQFVTKETKERLLFHITKLEIMKSKDEHFNDIRLERWGRILALGGTNKKMQEKGDYLTLAGKVCIFKEAAKQIKESERN